MIKTNFISSSKTLDKDVTHTNAKHEPIHRWFPYLEGFSETFISNIFDGISKSPSLVYEPFSGSGTVPVYCKRNGINCFYTEVNPFLQRLTKLKLEVFDLSLKQQKNLQKKISHLSNNFDQVINEHNIDSLLKERYENTFKNSIYFNEVNFRDILKASSFINSLKNGIFKDIVTIAVCDSLLSSSFLKRAGDIRFRKGKEKENIPAFKSLVIRKLGAISEDLTSLPTKKNNALLISGDNAKRLNPDFTNKVDAVITSPPYLNGTNYIRNTKLELWFLGFLKEQKDLSKYRKEVVTAGINDVTKIAKPIQVPRVQNILEKQELWYDRRIPKMISDYFYDMSEVIDNIYTYLKKDGLVFFDIGDSVYANQHIPTDKILCDIFKSKGFELIKNLKLRDRRSKSGKIVKQCLLILKK